MNFPKNFICVNRNMCNFEDYVSAPCLRRSFQLDSGVKKAKILVCGLGFYRLFVNGREITKGPLAPYISAPDDMLYYDEYDCAEHLQQGENVIGVLLGNGMQDSFGGYVWDFEKAVWRSSPKVALRLTVETEDGQTCEIESDEQFLCRESGIYFDDLRCGEYFNAHQNPKGWTLPGFNTCGWLAAQKAEAPRGEARLCEAEPIAIEKELHPVAITKQQGGYLYDFGENNAGVCRLSIDGSPGQMVEMEHGEYLKDGNLLLNNIQFEPDGYVQKDIYVCNGEGIETYVPSFTYHGFRYVLVRGITEEQAQKSLLTYLVMHSDLKERGGFDCSDPTLNTLQTFTRRSTLANFYYFPTDCPHREKNGWTGDAALSAEHTLLNLAPDESYREWLRNVRKSQTEEGELPGIVPTGTWGYHSCGPAWDCVVTWLPYEMYRYRGDKAIVEENATTIFRYLDSLEKITDEDGLVRFGLGDWCPPAREPDGAPAPVALTSTLTVMDICKKAVFLFKLLGQEKRAEFAQSLYDSYYTAARRGLIDYKTMTALGDCQTSQAMALYYGLFTKAEEQQAFEVLVKQIHEADDHMDCGVLGARVIFHVLSRFGQSELAYRMITTPTFPSYGNWIARGATSLWECFQPEGGTVNSLNHHFFGDISGWFIQWLAGIQMNPDATDCNTVVIHPSFIPQLNHAHGFHIAPAGKVEVSWRRQEEGIFLDVTVPCKMKGYIELEAPYCFAPDEAGQQPCRKKPVATGEYLIVEQTQE